jgi:hypothetical protein
MMQWWADHLDEFRERGDVVPLPTNVARQIAGA